MARTVAELAPALLSRPPKGGVDRRLTELNAAQATTDAVLAHASDLVIFLEADTTITWVSPSAQRLFGIRPDQLVGRVGLDIVHPEDQANVADTLASIPDFGDHGRVEFRVIDPTGATRWVEAILTNLLAERHVRSLVVHLRDVTDRRLADDEALLKTQVMACVGQAMVVVDLDRVITHWNAAAETVYGWSAAEAIGRRSTELLPRLEQPGQDQEVFDALSQGRSWSGEYEVRRRDGSHVSVSVTNTPVIGRDGRLVAVVGGSVDISARKAAEAVSQQLAAIVDGSGDAIFGTTVAGVITSWNRAAEELFGYRAEEIIGQPVALLAPEERAAEQDAVRARLAAGLGPERIETVRRRKDGSTVEVLITASTTEDDAGAVVGLSVIARDISERLVAQRALETSERRLAVAQRIAQVGSFDYDIATRRLSWSEECARIMGLDPDTPGSGELFMSIVHPDDVERAARSWTEAMSGGQSFDQELRLVRPDGSQRVVRARSSTVVDASGAAVAVSGTMADQTDRAEADRVKREAESRFEIGFEQSAIGAAIADLDGIPRRVNPALCALLRRPQEDLVDQRWVGFTHPDEAPLTEAAAPRFRGGHTTFQDERRYLLPDGSTVWAAVHLTLVRDSAAVPQYFFVQVQDITVRKQMEEDLSRRVRHDSLTGLPNRAMLDERLDQGLARCRQDGSHLAVLFLDLDNFKLVNDALGHGVGDEMLRWTADRIVESIRPGDTAVRFGGDEFVIVCEDVTDDEVTRIAERVIESLAQPCSIDARDLSVTASIGTVRSEPSMTREDLLRASDAAMYRAKARGRARVEVSDASSRAGDERLLAIRSALSHVVERGELSIEYQPIVDLGTGAIVSAEALLRWNHPELGAVSPDEFIPEAEATGFILPIGSWVLEQACRQLARWQVSHPTMSVSVNVSVRQLLSSDVLAVVQAILNRTRVRPETVCLELTETVFMQDADHFERTLTSLKDMGVVLAIDDFGTGYSSLSYLRRFPIDSVKVDRAFVEGLGTDTHDSALVAAIIAMAEALDLSVTAEGIETPQQLDRLTALGCQRAQGYYLGRPMTAAALTRLLTGARAQVSAPA